MLLAKYDNSMPKNKYKFAVIGKGFIFPRHEQAIKACGGQVVLTCDVNPKTKPDFTDWIEMFNHPKFQEITHVSICTPNYLHSTISREALLLGKKVLCEKPLSINGTRGMEQAKAVMQLRYHPALQDLKRPEHMVIEAKMFRDEKYWKSWKGNEVKSGGILYNLGVHYIDLAVFLLGDNWEVRSVQKGLKSISATVLFNGGSHKECMVEFIISVVDSPKKQGRRLIADGKEILLSNADNLSYEDLHKKVYTEFVAGRGISCYKARKSLELIEAILRPYARKM